MIRSEVWRAALGVAAVLMLRPPAAVFAADAPWVPPCLKTNECLATGYYADPNKVIAVGSWLPLPAPGPGSETDAADATVFFRTRAVLMTDRGVLAAHDDVLEYSRLAKQFGDRLHIPLEKLGPGAKFRDVLMKVEIDAARMAGAGKDLGFRLRPFARWPDYKNCVAPEDMSRNPDYDTGLERSSSYPSGHAAIGMAWGLVLRDLFDNETEQAEALTAGLDFGESRVICGFHYESDVVAGRMAAIALIDRLKHDPDTHFLADLAQAKTELAALRVAPSKTAGPEARSKHRSRR